jgi:hypothetical protein
MPHRESLGQTIKVVNDIKPCIANSYVPIGSVRSFKKSVHPFKKIRAFLQNSVM